MDPYEIDLIEHWISGHPLLVEAAWITHGMSLLGWFSINPWSETEVVIRAYEGTINVFGVVAPITEVDAWGPAHALFGAW